MLHPKSMLHPNTHTKDVFLFPFPIYFLLFYFFIYLHPNTHTKDVFLFPFPISFILPNNHAANTLVFTFLLSRIFSPLLTKIFSPDQQEASGTHQRRFRAVFSRSSGSLRASSSSLPTPPTSLGTFLSSFSNFVVYLFFHRALILRVHTYHNLARACARVHTHTHAHTHTHPGRSQILLSSHATQKHIPFTHITISHARARACTHTHTRTHAHTV